MVVSLAQYPSKLYPLRKRKRLCTWTIRFCENTVLQFSLSFSFVFVTKTSTLDIKLIIYRELFFLDLTERCYQNRAIHNSCLVSLVMNDQKKVALVVLTRWNLSWVYWIAFSRTVARLLEMFRSSPGPDNVILSSCFVWAESSFQPLFPSGRLNPNRPLLYSLQGQYPGRTASMIRSRLVLTIKDVWLIISIRVKVGQQRLSALDIHFMLSNS